jgi:hypothetical protein
MKLLAGEKFRKQIIGILSTNKRNFRLCTKGKISEKTAKNEICTTF